MRKFAILALPLFAISLSACDDDSGANTNSDLTVSTTDLKGADLAGGGSDGSTDMAMVACTVGATCAPVLGSQIDRMGRAGVNTALTDPFWDDGTQTAAGHHAKQDAYNAASDPSAWATLAIGSSNVTAAFKAALAVFDSLSGTSDGMMANDGCGDQLAYGALSNANYITLTSVLADDQLYVNSNSGTCALYLGVEAGVLGVTNTDCGGRTPRYNTIDITYTALAVGSALLANSDACIAGTMTCAVSNGVTSDPDSTPSVGTFPFLGAAN